MKAGVLSGSHGDLSSLMTAIEHLREFGVQKIFHLGADYVDVQNYINMRRQIVKGSKEYDDTDFLSDFSDFLLKQSAPSGRVTNKDLDEVAWLKKNIIQVPAEKDPQFGLSNINNTDFDMMDGKFVAITNNPKTLNKEDIASANLILYGHTPKPQVDLLQSRFFINPGHVASTDGAQGTYGVLDFSGSAASFFVFNTKKELMFEKSLAQEKKRKFKTT